MWLLLISASTKSAGEFFIGRITESFLMFLTMHYIKKSLLMLHDHHLRALLRSDKVLKKLEMSQLLCLDDSTIPLLCAGLANVPQVPVERDNYVGLI